MHSPSPTCLTTSPRSWLIVRLSYAAISLALALNVAPQRASAETKWEITPYRVRACIVAADGGEWSIGQISELLRDVAQLATSHLGAAWQFATMEPSDSLRGEMIARLNQLTAERVFALDPQVAAGDKLFMVVVSRAAHREIVDIRELDVATRQLGPQFTRTAGHRNQLPEVVLQAIVESFSPLVELQRAEGNTIAGKLRAAALIDDPQSPLVVEADTPLVPILRIDDRLGRTTSDQVSVLPITVLSVVARDGADVSCEIHSATRHRLGARASLRLSRYGLAVKSPRRGTRVVLQTPGASAAPLVDYDLVENNAAAEGVQLVGRTNARGIAEIAAGDRPWRMLYVRHGEQLLARLPLVTGYHTEIVVPLASNDVRLRAQGFVAALKQEVVDTVARRQILAARLRQRIAAGKFDEAQSVLDELQRLAGSREFDLRLQDARTQLVGDNARTQQHIDELFRETRQSLARYLDPSEIKRLETQLAQARRPR